jgi:hypothetical protein
MTNIKKFLFIGLLGIALPTLCMEPEDVPEVHVLDDEQEWVSIKKMGHVVPLLKKVVACRSEALDQNDRIIYTMDATNPTRYGFITDQGPWHDNYDLRILCTDLRGNARVWFLNKDSLKSTHSFMRLLTYKEACRMSGDASRGKLLFYQLCDLTLDNLIPRERIKYFRTQAGKQAWEWQRLLLLGHQDPQSPLHLVLKDIIRTLGRYTLHAQAYELLDHAKPDAVLDL